MSQSNSSPVLEFASVESDVKLLRIALVVCTCNRPKGLERVVTSLAKLQMPSHYLAQLLIIDNSADGNARQTVEQLKAGLPWEVQYVHETKSGISFARNAALEYVIPRQFDYMASVDDDMHVDPEWLVELIEIATSSSDAAVIGRRKIDYPGEKHWWVDEAYRLDSHEPADGALLEQGHTGGCLVKLDCVRSLKLRFDEDLSKSGGEDTLFFAQILDNGDNIRFASKAISYEVLGADRMRVRWWLKRWYRTGNTSALVSMATNHSSRFRVFYDGVVRVTLGLAGTVLCMPWLMRRRTKGMRAVRMVFRGSGYIAAVMGARYDEYAEGGRGEV